MPRPVVPMRPAPLRSSRARSSAPCDGRISAALSASLRVSRRHLDALFADRVDLVDQRPRIDDDAVADDRQFARPHHARRQQAQLVFDIADDEGVAGIVAALKAHHDVGPLRQPVDDLALAFVAPLGADHGDITHRASPSPERQHLAALEDVAAAESARLRAPVGGGFERGNGDPALGAQHGAIGAVGAERQQQAAGCRRLAARFARIASV